MNGNFASIQQRRLARFVDRDEEMRVFCAMLDSMPADQPVCVVWGEGGIGKSSLLDRMEQECHVRGVARSRILWSETRNYDYLGLMRKIREAFGGDKFMRFNDVANFFTKPEYKLQLEVSGSVAVASGLQNRGGTIDTIAGVVIQDANISVPRADLAVSEADRMARLTDAFLQDLWAAAADRRVVVLLDAFEKASSITRTWVQDELIGALCDGRLGQLCIVLCGRNRPDWEDDLWLMVNEMHLTPLGREHIIDFVGKSQPSLPQQVVPYLADLLLASTKGIPSELANMLSAAAKQWQPRAA